MNEHDSEKISGLLSHRGMVPVHSLEEADLFILNTCSVREKAVHKVYSRLGEIRKQRGSDPNFFIGVVGCVAQQESQNMTQKAPFVDLVVGTHMYHALPDLLDNLDKKNKPIKQLVATEFSDDPAPVEIASVLRASQFRANITITEGCNKHCSFCIVPYTRGKERNRPALTILEEVRKAADQGFVEILLLGQTVNSYKDPEKYSFKFADLLAKVAEIKGIRRVRFTSPHPREFDDSTISVIGEIETICNQVHLPVQSGSDPILKKMRRQYTREHFLKLVERFKNLQRPIALSTDVIVGFPGETDADFEQTLSLVKKVQFESMFSFKYSARPYTEAAPWTNEVPEAEKTKRLMMLQRLQTNLQLKIHRERYIGHQFEILVEGKARDGKQSFGRTTSNKIVNFPEILPPGTFAEILVTKVGPNSLVGRKFKKSIKNCA